ncbi:hypothetical protein FE257_010685 [Aspergillus nanangensis]|uniref:Thioester reductase (TE) domain-containing protein n=1 Tax=Aspergillus nanangensis TaxID=2582783 RepID=A0AAD4CI43_ASPNN|nr:hypothetical protein FE257_010685 [Aspergillus nanangensis]
MTMWSYYNDKTIFITGGSGFLGTALVHRLLTTARCRRIYLLARGGRSGLLHRWNTSLLPETAQWLLNHHRVTILEGDITQPLLGLHADQIRMLREEIDILIHAASSINLGHSLPQSCQKVIQPAQTVAGFALRCLSLQRFVYVSTAYANAHLHAPSLQPAVHIEERIYPLGKQPCRSASDELKELQARGSTPEYESYDFPWAYAYAKHLSERLLTEMFTERGWHDSLLILRPSIIGPAESRPFAGYVVPTSSPVTVVAAFLANTPATQVRFASTMKDPERNSTFDEVPVDVVVDRLLVHLARGSRGCVHAVSGDRASTSVRQLYTALCDLRWLPWRFRVVWVHEGWHSPGQHPISRVFKVFGTSYRFGEARTEALLQHDGEIEEKDLHLHLQGVRLFKTIDDDRPFELRSRRRQIYHCGLALSGKMSWLHRLVYRILCPFHSKDDDTFHRPSITAIDDTEYAPPMVGNGPGLLPGVSPGQTSGSTTAQYVCPQRHHFLPSNNKSIDRRLAHQWGCLPPAQETNSDPVFGVDRARKLYTAFQERRYIAYYSGRFRETATTFLTYFLLTHKIYTVDPRNIQRIYSEDAQSYSIGKDRSRAFHPLLGNGLFGAMDKDWDYARPLVMKALPRDRAFKTDLFAQHCSHLLARLPPCGETVDIQELFLCMTMDSATDLLFGRSIESLQNGTDRSTAQYFADSHEAQRGALSSIRMGRLRYLLPRQKSRIDRATRRCRSHTRELLSATDKDASSLPECVLRQLRESGLQESDLIDHLLTLLLAARDTTASLLSMAVYFLARQPQSWQRLREEVAVLHGETPSVPQVLQLKYVGWIINETLRLHPPAPHHTRIAVRDTTLPTGGGPDGQAPVFVAKGQAVSHDLYTLHRNPEAFGTDPEAFRPDRWESLKPGWAYMPFGGGPRMCPGRKFALVEATYTLVRLAQYAKRIEPRDEKAWEELLSFTCVNRHGTRVAVFRG